MTTIKTNWNITEIENLTEDDARDMAIETMTIKDHNVYFVDFGGYFGYSALVFMDGMHIHYTNDYELHHKYLNGDRDALRAAYIEKLNRKLFTEQEITSSCATYDEYKAKKEFLHNFYGMRRPHRSIFGIWTAEKEAEFHRETADMFYDPIAFAYYDDKSFVEHHVSLYDALEKAWAEHENDFDALKSAFKYEMRNHEYAINWQGNWDVLSVFGQVRYVEGDYDIENYFDQLRFTDVQRRAYYAARSEYLREDMERDG